MRSLFVQTLLAFLFANALAAAISLALSESLRPPHPAESTVQPVARAYGELAAALISGGQRATVARVAAELERDYGIRLQVEPAVAAAAEQPTSGRGRGPTPFGFEFKDSIAVASQPYEFDVFVPHPRRGRRPHSHPERYAQIGLALAAFVGVCYVFSTYLVAPVKRLQAAARTIAAGQLNARVGDKVGRRRDELGKLAQDFDRMAEHVESLIAEQKQLFRHASHELRTPLARLQVAVGLARQKQDDPLFDRIELECERLDRQIDDLLALAKLEAGAQTNSPTHVDPVRLMREVAADAEFEARGRGCSTELIVASPDDSLRVLADEAILRSALENVVRNAISFTAPGTRVSMHVLADAPGAGGRAVTIAIRDRGPGVPAEQLSSVFAPFFRGREGGVGGLGLTIAKRGIEMFGGEISAENAAEGGLAVTVRLPSAVR